MRNGYFHPYDSIVTRAELVTMLDRVISTADCGILFDMTTNEVKQAWSVWINESEKIITVKKSPGGKEIFFESREVGMKKVCELVSKGYRIG